HGHDGETLIPLPEVQELVLERCPPLELVEQPLLQSLGHVLAADAMVEEPIPPFANSAMDGYAVRSADTSQAPVQLQVVGVIPAGAAPPEAPLQAGQALQIMTGAPMPDGADGVAIVERTEKTGDASVRILDVVAPGANVRAAGSDFLPGAVALRAGITVGPAQIGILASLGWVEAPVWRKPRVGVMSTGDELVMGGVPLKPGQIRDSNRLTMLAMVQRDGFEPVDLGTVGDTEKEVEAVIERALGCCDAVLSSGGVSKGDFDFMKVVLDRLAVAGGGESFELGVAIRPAKPLALAWLARTPDARQTPLRRVPFFALPGNPVSAIVSYQVIALPGLRRMAGLPEPLPRTVRAVSAERLHPSRDGRLNLLRVEAAYREDGRLVVRSAGGQQSHQLSGMASANALALVPSGQVIVEGGDVELILFGALD
ncbi:MAG: molybdopterin molybdotransferase MoeA, partial [Acidimicrobiales bacterium]